MGRVCKKQGTILPLTNCYRCWLVVVLLCCTNFSSSSIGTSSIEQCIKPSLLEADCANRTISRHGSYYTYLRRYYPSPYLSKVMPGELEEVHGRRATFGMGCFWAGDSLFGALPGVIRTCVGYAGGRSDSPTYRDMGDHTEVIDIEYDPNLISYLQLLDLFWKNHEYGLTTKIKRQYMSLVLYHDEEQKAIAQKSLNAEQRKRSETFVTEIRRFDKFYPAEDYHQKYRLQNHPWLVESTGLDGSEILRSSPLAAKLNGYIAGAGTIEQLEKDLPRMGLNEKAGQYLMKYAIENQGNGLYC